MHTSAHLLVDPQSDPDEELRRFEEYYSDVASALAANREELEKKRASAEPRDPIERLNHEYTLRLLDQRVRQLEDHERLRAEHLRAVRACFASKG